MKKVIGILSICFIVLNVYIGYSSLNYQGSIRDSIFMIHSANSETAKPCVGDQKGLSQPSVGSMCYCNGQLVFPQTCVSGTGYCSPIYCH